MENYVEMEEGTYYILYLKDNTFGEYGVINMNNGKFNLQFEDQMVNIAEHGHDREKEEHEAFKKQVLERFEDVVKELDDQA